MTDKKRDRIYSMVKIYGSVDNKTIYLETVLYNIGADFVDEAEIVWDAIDQWEGLDDS